MPWISNHAARCSTCGRERADDEEFSRRGRCDECGEDRMIDNRRQLRAHDGPWFHHWRRCVAAAVGAVLMDDAETSE